MSTKLKLLLVEDNPGDAFLIKFYLEESTYKDAEIVHTEFLYSAVEILADKAFHIILLDLNLSDSKGMETLEKILAVAGNAVVIVLTGLTDEEYGRKALKMGAHDFLVKGQFDGKVLNSSVKYAFESTEIKNQLLSAKQSVEEELLKREALELLSGTGYWELNPEDNSVQLGHEMTKFLNGGAHSIKSFADLMNVIDKNEQNNFESEINKLVNGDAPLELNLSINNSKYTCLAKKVKLPLNKTKVVGVFKIAK